MENFSWHKNFIRIHQRCIQSPVKHLKWTFLQIQLTILHLYTLFDSCYFIPSNTSLIYLQIQLGILEIKLSNVSKQGKIYFSWASVPISFVPVLELGRLRLMKLTPYLNTLFYKQMKSRLSPQSWLYLQYFRV